MRFESALASLPYWRPRSDSSDARPTDRRARQSGVAADSMSVSG